MRLGLKLIFFHTCTLFDINNHSINKYTSNKTNTHFSDTRSQNKKKQFTYHETTNVILFGQKAS